MSSNAWPTALEYRAAIQNPRAAFRGAELRSASFNAGPMGPKSIEGQRAVVFLGRSKEGPVAVRCLKRPLDDGAERYTALRAYLADHPMPAITKADWREDGIKVGERTWPVITMEQVIGPSLHTFVEKNLSDPERLGQLAVDWRKLIAALSKACIAHGDLQQDNVMLADEEHLRLVDLDAVWLPTLSQLPPKERGHRHYQHPERLHTGYWGRYIDTFPALVIYVSLLALAADPKLFDDFNNDENLIFCDEDFAWPGLTPVWARLWASPDVGLRDAAKILQRCCKKTVKLDVDLDTLLSPGGFPATAVSWTTPATGPASPQWWWVVDNASAATPSAAAPAAGPETGTVPQEWWLRASQPWTRTQATTPAAQGPTPAAQATTSAAQAAKPAPQAGKATAKTSAKTPARKMSPAGIIAAIILAIAVLTVLLFVAAH